MAENEPEDKKNDVLTFLNKYWEGAVILAVIIIYLAITVNLTLSFKQVPSPLFGGDYYFSLGTIEHFKAGGSAFVNSALLGGLPHYFPVYTLIVGSLARIFSAESFATMKAFSFFEAVISVIVCYILGRRIFKNNFAALIFAVLYLDLKLFPVIKYLQFTMTFMLPLFYLALYYFFEKRNVLSGALLGIAFGLLGLSHSVAFITGVFTILVVGFYMLFVEKMHGFKIQLDKEYASHLVKSLLLLLLVAAIGISIAMLYWYKPIFVFHGQPLNPITEISQTDLSQPSIQFSAVIGVFTTYFLNFSSIYLAIRSILFIAGIVALFLAKKKSLSNIFLVLVLIASFIGSWHFLITEPLFRTNLSADYASFLMFDLTAALFAGIAVLMIRSFAKKYHYIVLGALLALVLFANVLQFEGYISTDRWIQAGKTPLPNSMVEMQTWVLNNTNVNDVFLSSNELSFALNALTGRKLVTLRRGHTDMFSDANKNMLDASIMLYSNDSLERERLLKERNVKYFFWEMDWIGLDYQFDSQGNLVNVYDPFLLFDTPETRVILQKNNISFYPQFTWMDPSTRNDNVKKFNALYVSPQNYFNATHPWNLGLDRYLQEVWSYKENGVATSRIFKVVNVG